MEALLPSVSINVFRKTASDLGCFADAEPSDDPEFDDTFRNLPLSSQESVLLENILYCFMGIEGSQVRRIRSRSVNAAGSTTTDSSANNASIRSKEEAVRKLCATVAPPLSFKINPSCDAGLQGVAQRCLKLCSPYYVITSFIRHNSDLRDGCVMRAICAALDDVIKEHAKLVINLETRLMMKKLTLQQTWLLIQEHLTKMNVLAEMCQVLGQNDAKGGVALGILHTKATALTGQATARQTLMDLTRLASVPYFKMLEKWVYHGHLVDVYNEFFVEQAGVHEGEIVPSNSSKEFPISYRVSKASVPPFLEGLDEDVLKAGYYFLLIQRSNMASAFNSCQPPIVYHPERPETYAAPIMAARAAAGETLLNLMLNKYDLIGRLRSLKHFYLMDQGDFVVIFADMAQSELLKSFATMIPSRLSSLFDLAIRTSSLSTDSNKDSVSLYVSDNINTLLKDVKDLNRAMSKVSLEDTQSDPDQMFPDSIWNRQAFAYEGISIHVKLEKPLSYIMSNFVCSAYDLLFRFLFFGRMVERELGQIWMEGRTPENIRANTLRHRMFTFIQSLNYYSNVEVIEPHWHKFEERLSNLKTVDQVIDYHQEFLRSVLRQCMFFHIDLMSQLMRILYIAQSFAHYVLSTGGKRKPKRRSFGAEEEQGEACFVPPSDKPAIEYFVTLYGDAVRDLRKLIENFKDVEARQMFLEVFNRIDFNRFYEEQVLSV